MCTCKQTLFKLHANNVRIINTLFTKKHNIYYKIDDACFFDHFIKSTFLLPATSTNEVGHTHVEIVYTNFLKII